MVYRIHFEPKGGYWCIQFHRHLFFWHTVTACDTDSSKHRVEKFDSLKEAEEFVAERGINKAYRRVGTSGTIAAIAAGGTMSQH